MLGGQTGFGTPQATSGGVFGSTPATGITFGTQPAVGTPQANAFGLGAAPAAGQITQPTLPFGAGTTQGTPFGAGSSTPVGLFTGPPTSQPPVPSFASSLGSTTATTKPTGLLGSTITTSTSIIPNLGIGSSTLTSTSTPAPAFSLGSFGKPTSTLTSTATSNLAGATFSAPAATTVSAGLGGVDISSSSVGFGGLAGSTANRTETKTVKENPIPNEIMQSAEEFRKFVKEQKSLSCEVARCSSKPLLKVEEDTEALRVILANCSANLQRFRSIADKLKLDTAKGLQHTEMAQRTHDTPPGLQYDNTAPLQYFAELVSQFERDIQLFRQEIENAERHVHSQTRATALTPADLNQAMRRLYDSFVALAGRLQMMHAQVKTQKEQYLSLRRYLLNDTTDVFEEAARARMNATLSSSGPRLPVRNKAGPTPFSSLGAQHGFRLGFGAAGTRPTFASTAPTATLAPMGWGGSAGTGSAQSFLGNTSFSSPLISSQTADNSQFQLQKPPIGNKRGKR